ncbi:MAG: sigma-70 family RNA polymerase sigma factor [Propioniciclava sp.]|uniref:sigma-70 family RNA polymerase sigma factor n=1 Tax=Propioniciclava sp. TaxID=2038686 RepID=UPI0039E3A4EC
MRSEPASEVPARPGTSGVAPFADYVRERSDGLVRMACLVTRDWEEARDAVQDALANLYPRWDQITPEHRDAYVHRSVTNACLIRLRRLRRVKPVAEPYALPGVRAASDQTEALALADEAWRLCGDLPPIQRAAVVLRFYRDLSFAEVGAALGCPESTARSHVHRALVALRTRHLEGDHHG